MPIKQWLTLNDIKRSPFIVFKCANSTVGNKKFFSFEIHTKVFTDEMMMSKVSYVWRYIRRKNGCVTGC